MKECQCACCESYRLHLAPDGTGDFRARCTCVQTPTGLRCPCPACLLAVRIAVLEAIQ